MAVRTARRVGSETPGRSLSTRLTVASLTSLSFTDGVFTGVSYSEPVRHIAAVNDPDVEMLVPPPVGQA